MTIAFFTAYWRLNEPQMT